MEAGGGGGGGGGQVVEADLYLCDQHNSAKGCCSVNIYISALKAVYGDVLGWARQPLFKPRV